MMTRRLIPILVLLLAFTSSCDQNGDFVLVGINRDIELGAQVSQQIASDPAQFPILSQAAYPAAYNMVNSIRDKILNSGKVTYKDEFVWDIKIIDQDVLNAFATPGGHIYVYTGLIKFLDTEDDLAGVIGHEIAHADQRHSVKQMQKNNGLQFLLNLIAGQETSYMEGLLIQYGGGLTSLAFSRSDESESDKYSVIYLCETDYKSDGAASFFQKMEESGLTSDGPGFLSTHPAPANRVEAIKAEAVERGCSTVALDPPSYQAIKNSLP